MLPPISSEEALFRCFNHQCVLLCLFGANFLIKNVNLTSSKDHLHTRNRLFYTVYLCCLVCGLSGRGIRQIVDNAVLSARERKDQPQKTRVFPPRKRKRMEEARETEKESEKRRVSPESALLTRPCSLFPLFPSSVSHLEILMSQRCQICKTSDTLLCTAKSRD